MFDSEDFQVVGFILGIGAMMMFTLAAVFWAEPLIFELVGSVATPIIFGLCLLVPAGILYAISLWKRRQEEKA